MSQQGEAAEQIVSMATNVTVKGIECATNLAGRGALSLAAFLIAALKDQKRTQGKARMRAFHGKPTKVFVIKAKDMKIFAAEARKYGILYAAIVNKKQPGGIVDVVVNANDAAKVNRIAERFALSTVDVEKIRADIQKTREERAKQPDAEKECSTPLAEKAAHTVEVTEKKPTPTVARMEEPNPSAPFSDSKERSGAGSSEPERTRPSVRQQLRKIRQERQADKAVQKPQPHRTKQKTKSKAR